MTTPAPPASTPTGKPERYHGLDLLRAVAMMLGLLMHASMAYSLPEVALSMGLEPVREDSIADWIYLLMGWIHQWRMPVFFVLAGFFGAMMLERRGAGGFFRDRLLRIGVALLVFATALDLLSPPYKGELGHLWFLYYLMGIAALASALAWILVRSSGAARVARGLAWPAKRLSTASLYLLPLIALTPLAREQGWAIIPERLGDFHLPSFAYYALIFAIGAALYQHRSVLQTIQRWPVIIGSLIVATLCMLLAMEALFALEGFKGSWLEWAPFSAISTAGWCLFFIGLSLRVLRGPNAVVSWFVGLSYGIYILHLYPSVGVGAIFLSWGWSAGEAFWPTVLATFIASVALYYVLIRFTPLDWLLAGPRKAWFRPHWVGLKRWGAVPRENPGGKS